MAGYYKKVIYLSYLEQGNRIKSAGFIKAEVAGTRWVFDMRVSGMAELAEKRYDIYVGNAKKEYVIGRIFLHKGSGEWKRSGEGNLPDTEGLTVGEVNRFFIKISDTEVIEGKYQALPIAEEKKKEKKEERPKENTDHLREKKEFHAAEKKEEAKRPPHAEEAAEPKKKINREKLGRSLEKEIRLEDVILDDKWEQLCRMYPVVHPYEDEREYISIQPKDFVVMTGDYQHLANNSFLLHGFYNYRHIILGREPLEEADGDGTAKGAEKEKANQGKKREKYGNFYLGVPGVYYEREKMVALMFGFEAFECCGGRAEPGKFGYYLRRVKI